MVSGQARVFAELFHSFLARKAPFVVDSPQDDGGLAFTQTPPLPICHCFYRFFGHCAAIGELRTRRSINGHIPAAVDLKTSAALLR